MAPKERVSTAAKVMLAGVVAVGLILVALALKWRVFAPLDEQEAPMPKPSAEATPSLR